MNDHMACVINGCGHDANTLDDVSRLPICWDYCLEIDAMRHDGPATLMDTVGDAFRFGLIAGALFSIGHGW